MFKELYTVEHSSLFLFHCGPCFVGNIQKEISLKRSRYLPTTFHFRAEIGRLRARKKNCVPGEGFVKICLVKKHVWEREGSLSARWMTLLVSVQRYDHIAKNDLKKTLLKTLKFSDCRESIRKHIRPSCREIFRLGFVCLASCTWKQRNSEIRANIRIAFKMFGQRVASLINVICNAKKNFCRARKGLGTSLALRGYAGLVSSGFLCKVA